MRIALASGAELELRLDGDRFLGIGEVTLEGFAMRDARRPMLPEIRTPEAELWTDLRLRGYDQGPDETILRLEGSWKADGWMEYMLHTVRNRYRADDWAADPVRDSDSVLELVLRPVTRTWRGRAHHGFSYRYRWSSPSRPIYRILDRGTWEPGGSLVGSEVWVRQGIAPAVWRCPSLEARYSSEWYLPPIEQPNIFQFFPFQAAMQGFTMTAAEAGVLFTWVTQPAHVRTLLEKRRGDGAFFHWHEHCGDLAHLFETAPMEVLWLAGATDRVDRLNLHEAAREAIWASLHEQAGLRQERVGSYGVIEEWGLPDFDRYRREGLPALAEAGVKTLFLPNEFENNMNVWSIGNMCCTVDLKVAESIDPESFRAFCREADARGMSVEMWGNTALSSLTYIHGLHAPDGHPGRIEFLPVEDSVSEVLRSAQAPWVRNPSGAIEADHYTPVFCAMNLRDPDITAHWHRRWRELAEGFGVRGIFVDSSFNMSADKFHWRQNAEPGRAGGATIDQTDALKEMRPVSEPPKAIESQYGAFLRLLAEMQGYGYVISTEDVGLFGISRSGPDLAERLAAPGLWQETYVDFDHRQVADPDDAFFRALAYRLMLKLYWVPATGELSWRYGGVADPADRPNPWQLGLLRAFDLLNPHMQRRTVLPEERGVVWESGEGQIIWSFAAVDLPLGGPRRVTWVLDGLDSEESHLTLGPRQIAWVR